MKSSHAKKSLIFPIQKVKKKKKTPWQVIVSNRNSLAPGKTLKSKHAIENINDRSFYLLLNDIFCFCYLETKKRLNSRWIRFFLF